jgi:hypothetical protein
VHCGAKKDRVQEGTGATGFVGNDEHVPGHPHEGVLEKGSLVMQAFEEDENGRVGKPTGQTDQAGQLKERKKNDQGLQNGGNNDGVNRIIWVNRRQTDFGPAEPENPVDEIKAHKGNKQREKKALRQNANVRIGFVLLESVLHPVSPPCKYGKGTDFEFRSIVVSFGVWVAIVKSVQLVVLDGGNFPVRFTHIFSENNGWKG